MDRKFPEMLKKLRTDRNLSQSQLAKDLNLAQSTIGMYESGQRIPDVNALEKLCEYFNVRLEYLIYGTNDSYEDAGQNYARSLYTAQEKGYTDEDIMLALDFLEKARKRDEEN